MSRTITLSELFTDEELNGIEQLWLTALPHEFHRRITEEFVRPAMARSGSPAVPEDDVDYFGYAIEHLMNQSGLEQGSRVSPRPSK